MPVKIPTTLPARAILENENVFVMDEDRAIHQDIRPLQVAILNLMLTKVATETQLLRLLSNSALQVEVTLLHTATYESKNTHADHLLEHYVTFEEVCTEKYDGLIVTGAPVEQMPFEEVDYWKELTRIFDWAETNVESTFYICWGDQAALYYRYGVQRQQTISANDFSQCVQQPEKFHIGWFTVRRAFEELRQPSNQVDQHFGG